MHKELLGKKISHIKARSSFNKAPLYDEKIQYFLSKLFERTEFALHKLDRKQIFFALMELRKGIAESFGTRNYVTFPIRKNQHKIVVDVNGALCSFFPSFNETNKRLNRSILIFLLGKVKSCIAQCRAHTHDDPSFVLKKRDEALKLVDTIQALALLVL